MPYLVRLAFSWGLGLALVAAIPAIGRWMVNATIVSLSIFARLAHLDFSARGPFVSLAGSDLEILQDCTPLMPTLALGAAIVAFPSAPRWRRIWGVLGAAAFLWIYNILRVLALALILRHHPAWFGFVHAYLWQTMTLAFVLLLFLVWVRFPGGKAGR